MKAYKILIPLNIIIILVCAFWYYKEPDFKPVVSLLGALGALIAQFFINDKKRKRDSVKMTQKSGSGSKNYQAGGDININS